MGKEGLPFQHDMFTGELVDNRSNYRKRLDKAQGQPRQITMFSLKETVVLGVSTRPWLKDMPAPQMTLTSQDPRTPEEIERDLMRKAESMTDSLFADLDSVAGATSVPLQVDTEADEPEQVAEAPEKSKPPKSDAYMELARITKEYATVIWIDDAHRQRFYNQLPIAILEAKDAGLTSSEITAAMQEGDYAGKQETEQKRSDGENLPPLSVKQDQIVSCAPNPQNIRQSWEVQAERHRVYVRRARARTRHWRKLGQSVVVFESSVKIVGQVAPTCYDEFVTHANANANTISTIPTLT